MEKYEFFEESDDYFNPKQIDLSAKEWVQNFFLLIFDELLSDYIFQKNQ